MYIFKNFEYLLNAQELDQTFDYLVRTLYMPTNLNVSIDKIISDAEKDIPNTTLIRLLDLCFSVCSPYLYHPILTRHGFFEDNANAFNHRTPGFKNWDDLINGRIEKFPTKPFGENNIMDSEDIGKFPKDFLNSDYINYLKEHVVLSFYYSYLSLNDKITDEVKDEKKGRWKGKTHNLKKFYEINYSFIKFIETISYSKEEVYDENENKNQRDADIDRIRNSIKEFSEILESKYEHLPYYLGDNFLGNDFGFKSVFTPNTVDSSLIVSLASKKTNNPYDKEKLKGLYTLSDEYDYEKFYSFINLLDDIVLQKEPIPSSNRYNIVKIRSKGKKDCISDESEILYNNYLLERLFHFDFISFLIKECTLHIKEGKEEKKDIEGIYKKVLIALSVFATLPNVFSRNIMAKTFLDSYLKVTKEVNYKTDLEEILQNWAVDIKYFKNFLLLAAFPILNTTFLYIISYYLHQASKNNDDFEFLSNAISKLFEDYIKTNKELLRWNIYKKYPRDNVDSIIEDYFFKHPENRKRAGVKEFNRSPSTVKCYLIRTNNSHKDANLIADEYHLFRAIYQLIFKEAMNPNYQTKPIIDTHEYSRTTPYSDAYAKTINYFLNYRNPTYNLNIVKA